MHTGIAYLKGLGLKEGALLPSGVFDVRKWSIVK